MAENLKALVDEMKSKGIETALLKKGGGLVYSTFAMEDPAPYLLRYLENNAVLMMKRAGDELSEIEINAQGRALLALPLEGYVLAGIIKEDNDRKVLREYAKTLEDML
jgi:hypothetical protein